MKVFVDTACWAALFNKKDNSHGKAKRIWKELLEKKALIFTTDYVFDETITLIRRRANFEVSQKCGENLISSKIVRMINISERNFSEAWLIFKKYGDQNLSFTDCTSFSCMREHHISKVFSFDKHFEAAGFEILQ